MMTLNLAAKSTPCTISLTLGISCLAPAGANQVKSLLLASDDVTPSIVLAKSASESEKLAAAEVAGYLGKIANKTVPILTGDINSPPTASRPQIIIGHHALNGDLRPEAMALEESVVSVEQNRIRIVGGSQPSVTTPKGEVFVRDRGTLYGAYHFLDKLGVRWYRPEPWGEYVPHLLKVSLPLGQQKFKPAYKYRTSTNLYRWYPDQTPEQRARVIQWGVRNFLNTNIGAENDRGGAYGIRINHNYKALMPAERYFKDHPEYFALVNGKRIAEGQPCMGNPAVRELFAQHAIELAKDSPQYDTISLEPNDGGNWCECELCRALDDPALLARNGSEPRLGKASLSNRVAFFNNYLAGRLREAVPSMKVAWYAYLGQSETPTTIKVLEPNVLVAPTSMAAAYGNYSKFLNDPAATGNRNFLEILQGWGKLTPLLTREYWSGGCWYGPLPMWTMLKDRLVHYRTYGVEGVINESHPSWGPQSDMHYILARLMWNPDLDLDAEMGEYCRNYYGPAAEPMLRYRQLLERASIEGPDWYFSGRFIDQLFVDETLVGKMKLEIEKAKELARGQDPYERRVRGDWAGYEVVRMRCEAEWYKRQGDMVKATAIWDGLEQFILSDKSGELFDSGPVMFPGIWKTMSAQVGITPSRVRKVKGNG